MDRSLNTKTLDTVVKPVLSMASVRSELGEAEVARRRSRRVLVLFSAILTGGVAAFSALPSTDDDFARQVTDLDLANQGGSATVDPSNDDRGRIEPASVAAELPANANISKTMASVQRAGSTNELVELAQTSAASSTAGAENADVKARSGPSTLLPSRQQPVSSKANQGPVPKAEGSFQRFDAPRVQPVMPIGLGTSSATQPTMVAMVDYPACTTGSAADVNGDGWGIENGRTCVVVAVAPSSVVRNTPPTKMVASSSPAITSTSLSISGVATATPIPMADKPADSYPMCESAIDLDGDGFGFENNWTCVIDVAKKATSAPIGSSSSNDTVSPEVAAPSPQSGTFPIVGSLYSPVFSTGSSTTWTPAVVAPAVVVSPTPANYFSGQPASAPASSTARSAAVQLDAADDAGSSPAVTSSSTPIYLTPIPVVDDSTNVVVPISASTAASVVTTGFSGSPISALDSSPVAPVASGSPTLDLLDATEAGEDQIAPVAPVSFVAASTSAAPVPVPECKDGVAADLDGDGLGFENGGYCQVPEPAVVPVVELPSAPIIPPMVETPAPVLVNGTLDTTPETLAQSVAVTPVESVVEVEPTIEVAEQTPVPATLVAEAELTPQATQNNETLLVGLQGIGSSTRLFGPGYDVTSRLPTVPDEPDAGESGTLDDGVYDANLPSSPVAVPAVTDSTVATDKDSDVDTNADGATGDSDGSNVFEITSVNEQSAVDVDLNGATKKELVSETVDLTTTIVTFGNDPNVYESRTGIYTDAPRSDEFGQGGTLLGPLLYDTPGGFTIDSSGSLSDEAGNPILVDGVEVFYASGGFFITGDGAEVSNADVRLAFNPTSANSEPVANDIEGIANTPITGLIPLILVEPIFPDLFADSNFEVINNGSEAFDSVLTVTTKFSQVSNSGVTWGGTATVDRDGNFIDKTGFRLFNIGKVTFDAEGNIEAGNGNIIPVGQIQLDHDWNIVNASNSILAPALWVNPDYVSEVNPAEMPEQDLAFNREIMPDDNIDTGQADQAVADQVPDEPKIRYDPSWNAIDENGNIIVGHADIIFDAVGNIIDDQGNIVMDKYGVVHSPIKVVTAQVIDVEEVVYESQEPDMGSESLVPDDSEDENGWSYVYGAPASDSLDDVEFGDAFPDLDAF